MPTTETTQSFTPTEALLAGGRQSEIDSILVHPERISRGSKLRIEQLRPILESKAPDRGRQGIEALRIKLPEAKKPSLEASDAIATFGAGEVSRVDKKGHALDGSPEAKASRDEAEQALGQVRDFLIYAEVSRELNIVNPTERNRVIKEHGMTERQWVNLQDRTLNSLAELNGMQELQNLDPDERRDLIQATLASDASFQEKVSSAMQKVAEKARKLSEQKVDTPAMEQAVKAQIEAITQRDQAINTILVTLEQQGVSEANRTRLKQIISDKISTGTELDVDAALVVVQANLIGLDSRNPAIMEIGNLARADQTIANIENQIARLRALKGTKGPGGAFYDPKPAILSLEATLTSEKGKKASLITTLHSSTDPLVLADAQERYNEIMAMTSNLKDGDGKYISPFGDEASHAMQAQKKVQETTTRVATLAPEMKNLQERLRSKKLEEESKLTSEAEAILQNAFVDVLLERETALSQANVELMKQETDVAVRQCRQRMDSNWMGVDEATRTPKVDRQKIGEDVRYLVYHKQDGAKQLLLRDLLGDHDGDLIDAQGDYVNYKDLDLNNLTDVQKAALEKATKDGLGAEHTKKLLTDFFAARGLKDRTLGIKWLGEWPMGALALKDHEWQMLNQNFGDQLVADLENSKTMNNREIIDRMKAQGIAPSSEKGKMLLSILAGLGIGAGIIATGGGLGLVGAAVVGSSIAARTAMGAVKTN